MSVEQLYAPSVLSWLTLVPNVVPQQIKSSSIGSDQIIASFVQGAELPASNLRVVIISPVQSANMSIAIYACKLI